MKLSNLLLIAGGGLIVVELLRRNGPGAAPGSTGGTASNGFSFWNWLSGITGQAPDPGIQPVQITPGLPPVGYGNYYGSGSSPSGGTTAYGLYAGGGPSVYGQF